MRKSLLDILACPVCKGDLEIEVIEESQDEIIKGELICKECGERYPVEDGIPNMLPPELREKV